jgi:hypothetical protein
MPDHVVMNYVECEAPAELTLVEWRRSRVAVAARKRSWLGPLRPVRRVPRLAI